MLKCKVDLNNIETKNVFGVGGVAKLIVQTCFLLRDKDKELKVGRNKERKQAETINKDKANKYAVYQVSSWLGPDTITQTRPCNIQQYFTAVKMLIFR